MNKQQICEKITQKHLDFIQFIDELNAGEFMFRYNNKWTAGQQLEHMVLCVKPLLQVFSLDKNIIAQKFGQTDRPGRTYDEIISAYDMKIKEGGKAPDRFVPPPVLIEKKQLLTATLTGLVSELVDKINTFSENELDTLLIPHPLLGNLTLREMLFNAIDHVQHHHELTVQYLSKKITVTDL